MVEQGGQLEQVVYHLRFKVWKASSLRKYLDYFILNFFFFKTRHKMDTSAACVPANLNGLNLKCLFHGLCKLQEVLAQVAFTLHNSSQTGTLIVE